MSSTKKVGESYRGHSYSVDFEYAEAGDASNLVNATITLDSSRLIPAKTPGFQVLGETEVAIQGSVVRYINFLVDGDKGRS